MISLRCLFEKTIEIPDEGLLPFEIVRLARKKGLVKSDRKQNMPDLKDGEYAIPRRLKDDKKWGINPLTGRKKKRKGITYLITTISPEERTLKNLPRDAKKKSKVRFQDWLMLKNTSVSHHSVGQAADGTWYGWSHRAITGFKPGQLVKPGHIGNKYEYTKEVTKKYNDMYDKDPKAAEEYRKSLAKFDPYEIKDDTEAMEHAIRFAADVA